MRANNNASSSAQRKNSTAQAKTESLAAAETDKATKGEDRLAFWTLVLSLATVALAVVAAGQLAMFWKQLEFMRRGAEDTKILANASRDYAVAAKIGAENSKAAVDAMQKASNAQLRAFVFPVSIFSLWEAIPGKDEYGWRIRPQWQNSGATPTKDLTTHASGALRDQPLPDDFDFNYQTDAVGNGLIPPRLTLLGGNVPPIPEPPITPQDILDIQAGKKMFFLWGWTRYSDVFPGTPEHITRFCWVLTVTGDPHAFKPNSSNPAEQLTFGYMYAPHGNCADEECA